MRRLELLAVLLAALSLLSTAAQAATVARTNRDAESMPSVPVPEEQKPKSGYYEPMGQAPIAVAHSLQLPCGNRFLMMVCAC
jgi:hypothetical protein